jgi:hypothetical protein
MAANLETRFICEYDVPVAIRDGVKIYVNIYRPKLKEKYPVMPASAPYGKHEEAEDYHAMLPGCGQSKALHSTYARFDGPDPADWCPSLVKASMVNLNLSKE